MVECRMKTNIDDMLVDQSLSSDQRQRLLLAEQHANHALLSQDAIVDLAQWASRDPRRQAVEAVLQQVSRELEAAIAEQVPSSHPTLTVVTGAPGSGKSGLVRTLLEGHPEAMWICGDMVKQRFKPLAAAHPALAGLAEWQNDAYIHRLTSALSWAALSQAQAQRCNVVLEMLGSDPQADVDLFATMAQQGYAVALHHVATSSARAIEGAIKRYFGEGPEAGRHVSLTRIGAQHRAILESFVETERLLTEAVPNSSTRLYDNRQWQMAAVYQRDGGEATGTLDVERFIDPPSTKKALWFSGDNHTADLVLFSHDEDGDLCVAAITRGKAPFQGHAAFPGGFVETDAKPGEAYRLGIEAPAEAARREFAEETLAHLDAAVELTPVGVFDDRLRDPRNSADAWVVSHAFAAMLPMPITLKGADDAEDAGWKKVRQLLEGAVPMAFDHGSILRKAMDTLGLRLDPKRRPGPRP